MAKKNPTSVKMAGGGMAYSERDEKGNIIIHFKHGYDETPEARMERIQNGPKASKFVPANNKCRGGRKNGKNAAIRESRGY